MEVSKKAASSFEREQRGPLLESERTDGVTFKPNDMFSVPLSLYRTSGIRGLLRIAHQWKLARRHLTLVEPTGSYYTSYVNPYLKLIRMIGERYGFKAAFDQWRETFNGCCVYIKRSEVRRLGRGLSAKLISEIEGRDYSPKELRGIQLMLNKACTELFRDARVLTEICDKAFEDFSKGP